MNTASASLRGTIIKIPDGSSPGLVFADSRQLPFQVEGVWRSPVAPAQNQTVELELDASGVVVGMNVVQARARFREELGQFAGGAGEHGQQAAEVAKGGFKQLLGRMGYPLMIASLVLWLAWFALSALSVNMGYVGKSFSFSELTGMSLTQGGATSSFGLWSLIGLLSILAPWVAPWLRQRWAPLLNIAPLAFVILSFARVRWQIHSAVNKALDQAGSLGGQQARAMAESMIRSMSEQVSRAISYDSGLWIVLLASACLAVMGFLHYRRSGIVAPIKAAG